MREPATISLLAPAKVNLCLDVLPPRADGYHPIRSIMQTVSLYDRLHVSLQPKGVSLECDMPELATPSNLVYRAALTLQQRHQVREGARLLLEKRIPTGAGLGGGSSDAAAALLALNELWGLHCGVTELVPLAAALGADVPFFLRGGCMLAEGIGERLTPVHPRLRYVLLLVKPAFAIETRWAYRAVDEFPSLDHPDPAVARSALEQGDFQALVAGLGNTMEAPIFAAYPELRRWKALLLEAGAPAVLMSGSGSTLFGLFATLPEAEAVQQTLLLQAPDEVWSYIVEPVDAIELRRLPGVQT